MKVTKGSDGYKATTIIKLDDEKQLQILTMKRWGGQLITTATVMINENGILTHKMYGDYSASILFETIPRITSKAVIAQHEKALTILETIKDAVTSFYKQKEMNHA